MTESNTPEVDRKEALRKAYGKATQDLREKHRGDFDALYAEHARALGVDYEPRKTPEQKAAEEFDALMEQYPFLRERAANPDAPQGQTVLGVVSPAEQG